MKLYETTTALELLWAQTDELMGDATLSQTELDSGLGELEKKLSELEGTHSEKCLNVACLIKNAEAESEAIAAEVERLAKRKKSAQSKADWLRRYLSGNMEPGTNLKDPRAQIGWRKSTAVEVAVKPEELPENLRRTKITVEADKTAIKANLEAGQEVAGCQLVTRFNLQIK